VDDEDDEEVVVAIVGLALDRVEMAAVVVDSLLVGVVVAEDDVVVDEEPMEFDARGNVVAVVADDGDGGRTSE